MKKIAFAVKGADGALGAGGVDGAFGINGAYGADGVPTGQVVLIVRKVRQSLIFHHNTKAPVYGRTAFPQYTGASVSRRRIKVVLDIRGRRCSRCR